MKGYRTLFFNGLVVAAAAVFELFTRADTYQGLELDPTLVVVLMGLANTILRVITTTPVGRGAPRIETKSAIPPAPTPPDLRARIARGFVAALALFVGLLLAGFVLVLPF